MTEPARPLVPARAAALALALTLALAPALAACGGSAKEPPATGDTSGARPPGGDSNPGLSGPEAHSPTPPDVPSGVKVPLEEEAPPPDFAVLSSEKSAGVTRMEVAYPSGDLTVRAFLFVPDDGGVHAGVVFNHGGVSGVSEDVRERGRALAALGYVVVAPAYRGEGGSEGRVEVAAGEVDDVIAATRILAARDDVDATRIAIAGSSHGALIAVLAAAREPGLYACVVEACGVMDVVAWYRYLVENGFDVSDSLSVAVYGTGPENKPEAFRRRNAELVVDQLTMPVLIQQGLKDKTVPPAQAEEFAQALRAAGNQNVTVHTYPLLGHAFWFWTDPRYHSPEALAQARTSWQDFTGFLAGYLGPGAPGSR